MAAMYKKVNKSMNNVDGFEEITEENPFLKPCLLCLSAQTGVNRSVFGIAKVGASLARVRVRNLYNAGFDIDQVPISFLASRLSDSDQDIKEFVDTYFVPLVFNGEQRVDLSTACKMFRNINIVTYCDGTFKADKIEKYLYGRLQEIGYSLEEVNEIIRQIALVPIATDRVKGTEKMSVFSFKDVNDLEVLSEIDVPFYEGHDQTMFLGLSPNVFSYLYKGDGEHDLKKYAYEEDVLAYISFVVSAILENSVENSRNNGFVPLNMAQLFRRVKEFHEMGLTKEQILEQLDQSLSYAGSPRLTKREALLLDKLDLSFDKIKKVSTDLGYVEQQSQSQSKQLLSLQKAIKENCTDINTLRILLEGIGWQVSKEQLEEIMNTPSDREIVQGLEGKQRIRK